MAVIRREIKRWDPNTNVSRTCSLEVTTEELGLEIIPETAVATLETAARIVEAIVLNALNSEGESLGS